MTPEPWTVTWAVLAERDFDRIVRWTKRRFGAAQAGHYGRLLLSGAAALASGPSAKGIVPRADLGDGIILLRPRTARRRASHFLACKLDPDLSRVVILRILHESMDLGRHVRDPD